MPEERIPGDATADALVAIYRKVERELRHIVRDAARRGATGTSIYFARQRQAIQKRLTVLRAANSELVPRVVLDSYIPAAQATGDVIGADPFTFAGPHEQQVSVLVRSLNGDLEGAIREVGRQANDAVRRAGLEEVAAGVARGEARRATSARLRQRLADEGTTALIDRGGRRWNLAVYSAMTVRTTSREAASVAVVERSKEEGIDLLTWSSHANPCPLCAPLDGRTFSISGRDGRFPRLEFTPPRHPNCRHVLTVAAATFEDFMQALEVA